MTAYYYTNEAGGDSEEYDAAIVLTKFEGEPWTIRQVECVLDIDGLEEFLKLFEEAFADAEKAGAALAISRDWLVPAGNREALWKGALLGALCQAGFWVTPEWTVERQEWEDWVSME